MKNNSEKGFVFITFALYVGLLLAIIFGMNSGLYLIKTEISTTNLCRRENLETMSLVKPLLKQLLKLNPQASFLRFQLRSAQLSLAAAIASGNPALIRQFTMEIKRIHSLQKILDRTQKSLIHSANALIKIRTIETGLRISKTIMKNSNLINKAKILKSSGSLDSYKFSKLAVIPDLKGLAPRYEPEMDFSERQKVTHFWHYQINIFKWIDSYLDNHIFSNKNCSATLIKENEEWKEILIEGK